MIFIVTVWNKIQHTEKNQHSGYSFSNFHLYAYNRAVSVDSIFYFISCKMYKLLILPFLNLNAPHFKIGNLSVKPIKVS